MASRRRVGLVLTLVLAVSFVGGAHLSERVAGQDVAIESVTVSPGTPEPGESFLVTTTIKNLDTSSAPVRITDVYVRSGSGLPEYKRVEMNTFLDAGTSIQVQLRLSFDSPGWKSLNVWVAGGRGLKLNYPLQVKVERPSKDVRLSVSSPETAVGDATDVNVTVANGDAAAVSSLELELAGGNATVTNPRRVSATLGAGAERSFVYDVRFEEPGEQPLTATLAYRDDDGDRRTVVESVGVPVESRAEATDVRLSFSTADPVVGVDTPVDVTVANGDLRAISAVELALEGDGVTVENPRRTSASIDGGTAREYAYSVTFDEPGERTLRATLRYTTREGYERATGESVTVGVEDATVDTDLGARVAENGSDIRATLTNLGNAPLTDVVVRAEAGGESYSPTVAPDLPPKGARTVRLDGSAVPDGTVAVVASYTAAGERRTSRTSLRYAPAPLAELTITGVDVTADGRVLAISGDAANVGRADVQSVLVGVVETAGVRPVNPHKEFFVGAIDASEFATFELTANVSRGVDEIPIRVRYTAEGERLSSVVTVDVGDVSEPRRGSRSGPFPGGLPLAAGLVVVVVIAAAVYWRRGR